MEINGRRFLTSLSGLHAYTYLHTKYLHTLTQTDIQTTHTPEPLQEIRSLMLPSCPHSHPRMACDSLQASWSIPNTGMSNLPLQLWLASALPHCYLSPLSLWHLPRLNSWGCGYMWLSSSVARLRGSRGFKGPLDPKGPAVTKDQGSLLKKEFVSVRGCYRTSAVPQFAFASSLHTHTCFSFSLPCHAMTQHKALLSQCLALGPPAK